MKARAFPVRSVAAFAFVWGSAFAVYTLVYGGPAILPLLSLVVLGLLLPLLAWPLTRTIERPDLPLLSARDALIALAFIASFSWIVLGYGFSWVRDEIASRQAQEIILLGVKILFMAVLPLLLMRVAERGSLIAPSPSRRSIWVATAIVGAVAAIISALATQAIPRIAALELSAMALALAAVGTAVWVVLGAALTEEILFRAYLQPRLTGWLKSEAAAVAVGAIIFALVHVPGLYLRTDQADLMQNGSPSLMACIGYAIAALAPPGILFGVLWARTRSLLLVVMVHALIDLPPNIPDFVGLVG